MTEEELRKECCLKAVRFSSMLGVDIQDVGVGLIRGDDVSFILKRQRWCLHNIALSFKRTCQDIKIENIGELYPYAASLLLIEVPHDTAMEKLLEMATEYNMKAVHS